MRLSFLKNKKSNKNTVADYLTKEDVLAVLQDLEKEKAKIKNIVVIYTDNYGDTSYELSGGTKTSQAVWMLESAKNELLNG